MKRKRFAEEQIIRILKEAEASGDIRQKCRKHNISVQTLYRWRSKYPGLDVADTRRLKMLEQENTRLKKIVADLTMDVAALKEINSKNGKPDGAAPWLARSANGRGSLALVANT
ncbi:MAG: transposase [Bdellovibrionales bacterium]|nr:transposase [Bdellovibrionales bacterium]